jgi:hypothetical protein
LSLTATVSSKLDETAMAVLERGLDRQNHANLQRTIGVLSRKGTGQLFVK